VKQKLIKITISVCTASLLMISSHADARSSLTGIAELAYVNFDAKADNPLTGIKSRVSGDSFAQKYSLTWTSTNLLYRTQPQYYNLSLGYDWLNFDTKISDGSTDTRMKEVFGKFHYDSEVGYNPVNLPITFRAYASDPEPLKFKQSAGIYGLIDDNLVTTIEGRRSAEAYGATFVFEPDMATSTAFRGLPRLHLDYKESFNKSLSGSMYKFDIATKELAVAGLSKQNNWVHYRTLKYEDRLDKSNNYDQQQFQIGHVDYRGRRLWSSLTNWIEVSADGLLTTRRGADSGEEYDVNFMAIATRRDWDARSFMNYNRIISSKNNINSDNSLIETAKIPVYVKGIYGSETNWYVMVSAENGSKTLYDSANRKEISYSNTVSVGATTFNRSEFTLSPSLSVTRSKGFGGTDALDLTAAVDTASTARYSNIIGLAARNEFKYSDNGSNSEASKTWYNKIYLNANYRPDHKFVYNISEELEAGEALPVNNTIGNIGLKKYLRTYTVASAAWMPKAAFTTTLNGSYELRKTEDNPDSYDALLMHRLSYEHKEVSYLLDTKYTKKDNLNSHGWEFTNAGTAMYKPDRYNDGLLRYTYTKSEYNLTSYSKIDLLQRYSYNFFTRTGVIRNLASISQEIGYVSSEGSAMQKSSSKYLQLNGRYLPTEKLSLYGSVRYEKASPGTVATYYTAGLNADFKLLSTSVEYALAKRDSDNRVEKRLAATVRRSF
jgi:hypothetical protein